VVLHSVVQLEWLEYARHEGSVQQHCEGSVWISEVEVIDYLLYPADQAPSYSRVSVALRSKSRVIKDLLQSLGEHAVAEARRWKTLG
jgi:hypothetical protein